MHGVPPPRVESNLAAGYKSRLGIRMFILYALFYAGFVIINTFDPKLMGREVLGQTFAVVYGFGLIIFALILALIYNALCSRAEDRMAAAPDAEGEVFE